MVFLAFQIISGLDQMKYLALIAACLDAELVPQQITFILNYPTPLFDRGGSLTNLNYI